MGKIAKGEEEATKCGGDADVEKVLTQLFYLNITSRAVQLFCHMKMCLKNIARPNNNY